VEGTKGEKKLMSETQLKRQGDPASGSVKENVTTTWAHRTEISIRPEKDARLMGEKKKEVPCFASLRKRGLAGYASLRTGSWGRADQVLQRHSQRSLSHRVWKRGSGKTKVENGGKANTGFRWEGMDRDEFVTNRFKSLFIEPVHWDINFERKAGAFGGETSTTSGERAWGLIAYTGFLKGTGAIAAKKEMALAKRKGSNHRGKEKTRKRGRNSHWFEKEQSSPKSRRGEVLLRRLLD